MLRGILRGLYSLWELLSHPDCQKCRPILFYSYRLLLPSAGGEGKLLAAYSEIAGDGSLRIRLVWGVGGVQNAIRDDTLQSWIDKMFSLRHIGYCVVCDVDLFGFHLWYFWAVLYGLIIFRLADRWKLTGLLRCVAPLLLLMFFIGNFTPWSRMTRNFLFMGLPCMMLGRLIQERNGGKLSFLADSRYLWAYVCGSFVLVVVEMFVLNQMYADRGVRDMYIFTLPMLLPLFYCALRNPSFGEGSVWAVIGRKYSAYIYIFHVLVSCLLRLLVPWNTSSLVIAVYPFVVFGISLGVSWMFLKIVERCQTIFGRGDGRV